MVLKLGNGEERRIVYGEEGNERCIGRRNSCRGLIEVVPAESGSEAREASRGYLRERCWVRWRRIDLVVVAVGALVGGQCSVG